MKNKKVFALIVSLALIVGVVLPGTLAFSNEPAGQTQEAAAAADTKLTEEKTQEVKTQEVKTELPKTEEVKAEAPKAETPKAQEPQCTCNPKPAEGQPHQDTCPVKLAADRAAAEKAAAEAKAKLEAEKAKTEKTPAPKPEDKPAAEQKPATEQKPAAEQKPETEQKPEAEQKPAEEKSCTCEPKPGEGEAHKEGCPLYVAPQKPAEEKTCNCAPKPEDGKQHKVDCPLFQHLETCGENCTGEDCKCPCHLFDRLMACKTKEEMEALIAATDKEVLLLLSDTQVAKVEAHMVSIMPAPLPPIVIEESDPPVESEIYTPTVNYTNVAPFVGPVSGGNR